MKVFGPFQRWDSHYFLDISMRGYVYDKYTAFAPFYPLLITAGRTCFLLLLFLLAVIFDLN